MRFATIGMVLAFAIFAGFAVSAFFLPEPQMPGLTSEAEFMRGDVSATQNALALSGATLPGHDVFLKAYYICLTAFAVCASLVGARLFFRRQRGGRARGILMACNFPLLLAVCAAIYQSRYLHFWSQMNAGTHLWYVHQLRFSLTAALIAAALPALLAGLALRLMPGDKAT